MDIREVTVLIVDDETLARAAMRRALRPLSPLRILEAETGAEALDLIEREQPHVTLLDLGLPDIYGVEVLRRSRRKGYQGAVLAVTGDARQRTRSRVLASKADDYIVKPFSTAELRERMVMVLRRTRSFAQPLGRPRLELDREACRLRADGQEFELTLTEARLMDCLLEAEGTVVTHELLLAQLDTPTPGALHAHVRRLRRKLGPYGKLIVTVARRGYRLATP
ncbi:MAG: response regulator transcription factor [Polyangiaceae bacterium]|nr:response regulator transcription factor [Polyangiaceae bacterium]